MRKPLARLVEVLLLRALPGAVNIAALLLLAGWLGATGYGLFSTALATCGLLATLAFGPLKLAVVPRRAGLVGDDDGTVFDGALTAAALAVASVLAVAGALLFVAFRVEPGLAALVVALGIFTSLQELLHARLRFWHYAGAALLQSGLLVALLLLVVRPTPSLASALWVYALSYLAGAAASFLLAGAPRPRRPPQGLLPELLRVGVPFTASNLAESGLHIGFRYLLLAFGSPATLAVFSLAVDVAQRLVGVIVSVASFAIVPRAYQAAVSEGPVAFRRLLLSGAVVAGGVALAVMTAVLLADWAGMPPGGELFVPGVFVLVSLALIINRLKKMVLDPFAVHGGCPGSIPAGYLVAAPLALGLTFLSVRLGLDAGIYLSYLLGYALAGAVTFWFVWQAGSVELQS
jgi:O-antigen/teichoic acid export membrane protein